MTIQVKQNTKESATPTLLNNNIIAFTNLCRPDVAVDEANKTVLVYKTNCSVEIPEGYVGLLTIGPSYPGKSVVTVTPQLLPSGTHNDVLGFFKINTDAIPAFFKPEEEVLRLIIIKLDNIDLQVEEFVAVAENEVPVEATQEVEQSNIQE